MSNKHNKKKCQHCSLERPTVGGQFPFTNYVTTLHKNQLRQKKNYKTKITFTKYLERPTYKLHVPLHTTFIRLVQITINRASSINTTKCHNIFTKVKVSAHHKPK